MALSPANHALSLGNEFKVTKTFVISLFLESLFTNAEITLLNSKKRSTWVASIEDCSVVIDIIAREPSNGSNNTSHWNNALSGLLELTNKR